jgi:hypothetical protein
MYALSKTPLCKLVFQSRFRRRSATSTGTTLQAKPPLKPGVCLVYCARVLFDSHISFQIAVIVRGIRIRGKYILTSLLLAIVVLGVILLFLYLTRPLMHETFIVAWNHDIVKELNLKSGDNVFVWLWTAPPLSMQNAGGRVIRFYVTNPHAQVIAGYMPGISGTGLFTPFKFVAQQDGAYTLHFENSIGDSDNRTVSLYYRTTMSILGIPVDYVLICIIAVVAVVTVFLGIVFSVSKERKARPEVNPSNSAALNQTPQEGNDFAP